MKKLLLSITLVLLVTATSYLVGAFVEAEPNPFLWTENERITLVMFWFIFSCFIPAIVCNVKD